MHSQRCPNCREKNDVSVFVHGQWARCVRCNLRFQVDRQAVASDPAGAKPGELLPTDISAVRGGVEQIVVTAGPRLAPATFAEPARIQPDPGPPIIGSGELFPTPVQRPLAQERAQNSPPAPPAPPPPPSPAAAPAAAPAGDVRPRIPGYECTLLLGRGGMGEVWKAQQLSLARTVAVKFLAPSLAVEPDFVRRFERESTALAALAHPNIVAVIDRGSANGHWYFVMEFVEGRSLRDQLNEKPISRADLYRLLAQVARAVHYAHERGVVHRDLKPENILVDPHGNAKVADFGLAGMSEVGRSSLTMSQVAMGTAHYMAPEQRKDAKKVDGRADLYSLGVILYELLTGELPAGRFQTPREKVPTVHPLLDAMILRLLEQDPVRRPSKATELADLLDKLAAEERGERQVVVQPARTQVLSGVVRDVAKSPAKKAMVGGAAALLLLVFVLAIVKSAGTAGGTTRLAAKVDRVTPGKAVVTFGTGPEDSFQTVGSGWTAKKGELAREGATSPTTTREPRAYLRPLRVDFNDAALEVDVEVESPGGFFGGGGASSAELVLYRNRDQHVGVRMTLGDGAGYTVFTSVAGKGKPVKKDEPGVAEAEPKAGKKYHLELYVANGRVTALVDRKQVAATSVVGLGGVKAKAALGCRGRCRFTNLKVGGSLQDPPVASAAPR